MLILFYCLVLFIKPMGVEAEPVLCFFPAYQASFEGSLSISPSGYFTTSSLYGTFSFADGFKNQCVNITCSQNGFMILSTNLNLKGSFKMSFMMRIGEDASFNFTKLCLKLTDSTNSTIVLGRSNSKITFFMDGGVSEGSTLEPEKWYNITINLNVARDSLTVSSNSSQLFQASTGIKIHYLREVSLQIGAINPSSSIKACFDEFSILVSPIVFTDNPLYASSSSVPVRIMGDQFPTSPLDITIIRPNGSTLEKHTVSSVNTSYTSGFHGFSYSTSLSNPSPGTYTVYVNGSGYGVEYHFGVWDVPRVWERKSIINIKAGGLSPNSFVTLSVRNSTRELLNQRLNVNQYGRVDQNLIVPINLNLGALNTFLIYDGTYDFARMSGSTSLVEITVVKAVLNVTVTTDADTYERVKPITVNVLAKYKDGSSLSREGVVKLNFIQDGIEGRDIFMDYMHDSYWSKSIKLSASSPLGNYLIRVEALDQYGNSGTGNRTITLTAARLIVSLKNQLEEHYERSTKLNISVSVAYPDETLVGSGSVTLEMIRGQNRKGPFSLTNTGLGQWDISQLIPISEQTGNWIVRITAVDDSENSGDLSLGITIVPARLNIQLLNSMGNRFFRTENIPLSVVVKYPSQEVLSWEYGVVNASLVQTGDWLISSEFLQFSAGSWSGNISAPKDAPLGSHVFKISAMDLYGNYGIYNITVEVAKATLSIEAEGLRDVYQISFDTISIKSAVKYLDGSPMDEGNVTAVFSSGSTSAALTLKYENGKWVGQYPLSLTVPAGDYTLRINATDPYGNTGVKEFIFRVSNLYLILIIISIAITLAVSVSLLLVRRRRVTFQPPSEEYDVLG